MTQVYSDPSRANDAYALPDVEVFYASKGELELDICDPEGYDSPAGFYWWSCFPGCLPDGDPVGPFDTEQDAISDALSR